MAKGKKNKIPKTVAGVKIPRKLRKKIAPVLRAAKNPVVADILAAGVAAAIAALANSKTTRAAAAKAGDDAVEAADKTVKRAKRAGSAAKGVAIGVARHLIDAYEAKPPRARKKQAKSRRAGNGGAGARAH